MNTIGSIQSLASILCEPDGLSSNSDVATFRPGLKWAISANDWARVK